MPRRREGADGNRALLLLQGPAAAAIRELNAGVEPGGAIRIAEIGNGVDPDLGVLAGAVAHIGQQQVATHTHRHSGQGAVQATVGRREDGALPAQVGVAEVNAAIRVNLHTLHGRAVGRQHIQALQADRAVAVGIGEGQARIGGGEHRGRHDR